MFRFGPSAKRRRRNSRPRFPAASVHVYNSPSFDAALTSIQDHGRLGLGSPGCDPNAAPD